MRAVSSHCSQTKSRVNLVWRVVLALFVLRALIPVGFMPDFSAAKQGRIALAFCTVGGAKTRLVDVPGRSVQDDSGKSGEHASSGECPFAASASPGLLPVVSLALPLFPIFSDATASTFEAFVSASPRGPPLGSRAPPSLLS